MAVREAAFRVGRTGDLVRFAKSSVGTAWLNVPGDKTKTTGEEEEDGGDEEGGGRKAEEGGGTEEEKDDKGRGKEGEEERERGRRERRGRGRGRGGETKGRDGRRTRVRGTRETCLCRAIVLIRESGNSTITRICSLYMPGNSGIRISSNTLLQNAG